jgi:hypothetical protein
MGRSFQEGFTRVDAAIPLRVVTLPPALMQLTNRVGLLSECRHHTPQADIPLLIVVSKLKITSEWPFLTGQCL